MKIKEISSIFLVFSAMHLFGQANTFIRGGLNYGTISEDIWPFSDIDTFEYDKPLIRPVIGFGVQYSLGKYWRIRQELYFQIKGQGTKVPSVRTAFRTVNPDIVRFISMPFSVHRELFPHFNVGVGFQPSLYLSGSDNYGFKKSWHNWIWSVVANVHYMNGDFELGAEYDHDWQLYYCDQCNIRFNTLRIYAGYHFID